MTSKLVSIGPGGKVIINKPKPEVKPRTAPKPATPPPPARVVVAPHEGRKVLPPRALEPPKPFDPWPLRWYSFTLSRFFDMKEWTRRALGGDLPSIKQLNPQCRGCRKHEERRKKGLYAWHYPSDTPCLSDNYTASVAEHVGLPRTGATS